MKSSALIVRCLRGWKSPPSRGAWIEIARIMSCAMVTPMSPPSRGAWIEIIFAYNLQIFCEVAPLAGGVD